MNNPELDLHQLEEDVEGELVTGPVPPERFSQVVLAGIAAAVLLVAGIGFLYYRKLRKDQPGPVRRPPTYQARKEALIVSQTSYLNRTTLRLAGAALFWALTLVAGVGALLLVYFFTIGTPPEAILPPGLSREARLEERPPVLELEQQRLDLEAGHVERIGSYGWIDQTAGVVRMPIDQAIQRLLQEQGNP